MIGELRIPLENGLYENYCGEICDDKANGFGISENNKGETYIGDFINNKTSFCEYFGINESNSLLDPIDMLEVIGKQGVTSLLIEGGQQILNTFYSNDLIDEMYIYSSKDTIKDASLMNPLKISEDWHVTDELDLIDDRLVVARKKDLCLQAL